MNENAPFNPEHAAPSHAESVLTLVIALVLLTAIVVSVMSCGGSDLTFPGQIPFTDTPGSTQTPTVTPTP